VTAPLAPDTSPDIEQLQVEGWRAMSPAQKARLITGLSQAARTMALAGIRHRYPAASPREHFLRLAILTLGVELATSAYPEIRDLNLA
jgi:hypothetical protein